MKSFIYKCFIGGSVALSMTLSSCLGDLDLKPIDDNVIQLSDFKDNPQYYTQLLAKVYAGLAVSGQEGPAGNPDIQGFDEGQAQYLRAYWNLQELPTDEAVLGWNDAGLPELSMSTWSAANGFVYVMYSRVFFQIALCNDFLRNTTPTALAANDVPEDVAAQIQTYRAEARVLRALSYWHAIDLFGAVSFVTEENKIMEAPKQKSRAEIYQFILDELNAVEESIPLQPQYGRVGRDAVNMIRAKLYLNAAVYTGTPQYGLCAAECEKIIARHNTGTNHGLAETYKYLFGGDNDRYARGGNESEILMTVPFDSDSIRSYGGTMYLTVGSYGGKISARNYGVNDAWAGPRSTSTLVLSFSPQDERYAFFSEGASINNTNLSTYQDGYSVVKFTNLLSTDWDNAAGRAESYPDTDFPLFRLADVYLMYAECAYRGAADREQDIVALHPALAADDVHRRERARVADATDPNTATTQTGYAANIISSAGREMLPAGMQVSTIVPEVKLLYNPQMKSAYNFVPGVMGLILMLICAMMTSISIVREKETGTMEILLVSPVKPLFIILAKAVPYFVLSFVNLTTILLLSVHVLDVPVAGSLFWLIVVSLLFIFVSLALGLLISSVTRTQVAAMLASGLILMMPTMLLSGMIFPIESMPLLLQGISAVLPARWYIQAVRKLMIEGVDISLVLTEVSILAVMAVALITFSFKKFKNRLE